MAFDYTIDPSALSDGGIPGFVSPPGTGSGDVTVAGGVLVGSLAGQGSIDGAHAFGLEQIAELTVGNLGTMGLNIFAPGPMILYDGLTGNLGWHLEYNATIVNLRIKQYSAVAQFSTTSVSPGDRLTLRSTDTDGAGAVLIEAFLNDAPLLDADGLPLKWGPDPTPGYATATRVGLYSRYLPTGWTGSLFEYGTFVPAGGGSTPTTISPLSQAQLLVSGGTAPSVTQNVNSTITSPKPLKNNTATLQTGLTGLIAHVFSASGLYLGSVVSVTSDGSGIVSFTAAVPVGTACRVVVMNPSVGGPMGVFFATST